MKPVKPETTVLKKSPYFDSKCKSRPKSACNSTQNGRAKCVRKILTEKWTPPKSPYCLIQEILYHDPWQLLIATIFLNKTSGRVAVPLVINFLEKYPNPVSILEAPEEDISEFLQPIGLHYRRARVIKRFTGESYSISFSRAEAKRADFGGDT